MKMLIENNSKQALVPFGIVGAGEPVMRHQGTTVYIKIHDHNKNAVNLENGLVYYFKPDELVRVVKAKVVVEDL